MPIEEYFSGHGKEVMADIKRLHGKKKAKEIFYRRANKLKQKPLDTRPKGKFHED